MTELSFSLLLACDAVLALAWLFLRSYLLPRLLISLAIAIACSYTYLQAERMHMLKLDSLDAFDTLIFSTGATAAVSYFNQISVTALLFYNISGSFLDGFIGELSESQHFQKFRTMDPTLVEHFRGTFLGVYSSFVGIVLGASEYLVEQNGSLVQGIFYFVATFLFSVLALESGILLAKRRERAAESFLLEQDSGRLAITFINSLRELCIGLAVFTLFFFYEYQLVVSYFLAACGCFFGGAISDYLNDIFLVETPKDSKMMELLTGFVCNVVASLLGLAVLLQCEFMPSVCKFDEILVYEFSESFLGSASSFISSVQVFHATARDNLRTFQGKKRDGWMRELDYVYHSRIMAEFALLFFSLSMFHVVN